LQAANVIATLVIVEPLEAIEKLDQILDEERANPTVDYRAGAEAAKSPVGEALSFIGLTNERNTRPRRVHENPGRYVFDSVNYQLLSALFSQVDSNTSYSLLGRMLSRILDGSSFLRTTNCAFPTWNLLVSELPLIAEFCVRRGEKQSLLRTVGESHPTPGLLLLLMQLEEMISLNFNLFTDEEFKQLPVTFSNIQRAIGEMSGKHQPLRPPWTRQGNIDLAQFAFAMEQLCEGIIKQCQKARYLYLKGSLLTGVNLEINQDKTSVEGYLQKLGFDPALVGSLNHAEQLYRSNSQFDLKSCLDHLRSFLEALGLQSAQRIYAKKGGSAKPAKWGEVPSYLRQVNLFSEKEENFVRTLYTLISDKGVHSLIGEKEYARLLRNVVIEVGLLILTKTAKLGV